MGEKGDGVVIERGELYVDQRFAARTLVDPSD